MRHRTRPDRVGRVQKIKGHHFWGPAGPQNAESRIRGSGTRLRLFVQSSTSSLRSTLSGSRESLATRFAPCSGLTLTRSVGDARMAKNRRFRGFLPDPQRYGKAHIFDPFFEGFFGFPGPHPGTAFCGAKLGSPVGTRESQKNTQKRGQKCELSHTFGGPAEIPEIVVFFAIRVTWDHFSEPARSGRPSKKSSRIVQKVSFFDFVDKQHRFYVFFGTII